MHSRHRLGLSFFLFGLTNNVLYVIILSAAVDLSPYTPKGLVAFVNIFPALVAKLGAAYVLKGHIHYTRRLITCASISSLGMLVVAFSNSLSPRLVGIALASFSSGLGELTFLQLSTTYTPALGGHAVGYFASGTGAAGLAGAFFWWILRNLGIRIGVGISSVLPIIIPITFYYLLPSQGDLGDIRSEYLEVPYTPIGLTEEEGEEDNPAPPKSGSLTLADKWGLVRPLLVRYMLPLFAVYTLEYTINSGICPTLLYPLPRTGLLSKIFRDLKDYYPTWQLTYQAAVFLSRSSISIGMKPLPAPFLPMPAVIQAVVLLVLAYESGRGIFAADATTMPVLLVFILILIEGLCGGLAYVNVFYHINQEPESDSHDLKRSQQEREFKIGSLGFSDSLGILFASLLSIPTEISLCNMQANRGKLLCKQI